VISNDQILALLTISGSLVLASRAYIAKRVPLSQTVWMALTWVVIIAAVAWGFRLLGAH